MTEANDEANELRAINCLVAALFTHIRAQMPASIAARLHKAYGGTWCIEETTGLFKYNQMVFCPTLSQHQVLSRELWFFRSEII